MELIDQPAWLVGFRAKYDVSYPLHITLKQMAYADESDYSDIKSSLERILDANSFKGQNIRLIFDTVVADKHDSDNNKGYIYLFASQRNAFLDNLQKSIRKQLAGYSDYLLKDSRAYEYEFKPHITIGRGLDEKTFALAIGELPANVSCTGRMVNVTLSFVRELSLQETSNPHNLMVYIC
jgi:2'-5' RNA ligase